jgi:hypothetical protein
MPMKIANQTKSANDALEIPTFKAFHGYACDGCRPRQRIQKGHFSLNNFIEAPAGPDSKN